MKKVILILMAIVFHLLQVFRRFLEALKVVICQEEK